MAEDLCKTPQKRKKRVKYEQKYKSEYRDEFKCINKSSVGDTFAFCNLCRFTSHRSRSRRSWRSEKTLLDAKACACRDRCEVSAVGVVVCWCRSVGGGNLFWIIVYIIPGWTQHPTFGIRSCRSTFQEDVSGQWTGKEIWFCPHYDNLHDISISEKFTVSEWVSEWV